MLVHRTNLLWALLKVANSSMRLVSKWPSGSGVCQHLKGPLRRLNEVSEKTPAAYLDRHLLLFFFFFLTLWHTGDHLSLFSVIISGHAIPRNWC